MRVKVRDDRIGPDANRVRVARQLVDGQSTQSTRELGRLCPPYLVKVGALHVAGSRASMCETWQGPLHAVESSDTAHQGRIFFHTYVVSQTIDPARDCALTAAAARRSRQFHLSSGSGCMPSYRLRNSSDLEGASWRSPSVSDMIRRQHAGMNVSATTTTSRRTRTDLMNLTVSESG